MRAVEQMHLTFTVRGHIVSNNDVKSGFRQRQLLGQPCGAFNYPEQERLGSYHQIVQITQFRFQLSCLVTRVSWHDPVHQAAAECVLFN
ncbi:hypothetical protein D3C81_1779490 [compost metagenome]